MIAKPPLPPSNKTLYGVLPGYSMSRSSALNMSLLEFLVPILSTGSWVSSSCCATRNSHSPRNKEINHMTFLGTTIGTRRIMWFLINNTCKVQSTFTRALKIMWLSCEVHLTQWGSIFIIKSDERQGKNEEFLTFEIFSRKMFLNVTINVHLPWVIKMYCRLYKHKHFETTSHIFHIL